MSILIITRSDDGPAANMVIEKVKALGGQPVRFDTDLYPEGIQLSSRVSNDGISRLLITPQGRYNLDEVTAVYYRRFFAGGRLPAHLGDMREPSVNEARRTTYGMIAALDAFQLDPLTSVRKCDHKELQLKRAKELGLDIPRTMFSNDPAEVRRFFDEVGGRMITKMQSSFALYREGKEQVVFTTKVEKDDLTDLTGLRFCPMTFQELHDKQVELRVTVVGKQVFSASIDSQKMEKTSLDWRRDGVALLNDWKPYTLPEPIQASLLALVEEFGLNYAAADFIVTPDGRHLFLEINAGGEWFWLQRAPGLPIAEALAKVLLGQAERTIVKA